MPNCVSSTGVGWTACGPCTGPLQRVCLKPCDVGDIRPCCCYNEGCCDCTPCCHGCLNRLCCCGCGPWCPPCCPRTPRLVYIRRPSCRGCCSCGCGCCAIKGCCCGC